MKTTLIFTLFALLLSCSNNSQNPNNQIEQEQQQQEPELPALSSIGKDKGLQSNNVEQITTDGTNLFVATDQGISVGALTLKVSTKFETRSRETHIRSMAVSKDSLWLSTDTMSLGTKKIAELNDDTIPWVIPELLDKGKKYTTAEFVRLGNSIVARVEVKPYDTALSYLVKIDNDAFTKTMSLSNQKFGYYIVSPVEHKFFPNAFITASDEGLIFIKDDLSVFRLLPRTTITTKTFHAHSLIIIDNTIFVLMTDYTGGSSKVAMATGTLDASASIKDWNFVESSFVSSATSDAQMITAGNKIWISTIKGGLTSYDPATKTFDTKQYGTSSALKTDNVTSLVANGNAVWIGTDKGLFYVKDISDPTKAL